MDIIIMKHMLGYYSHKYFIVYAIFYGSRV